jgi:ribose transport system permease protein
MRDASNTLDPSAEVRAPQKSDAIERAKTPHGLASLLGQLQPGRFSGVVIFAVIFATFAIWVPDTFLTAVTWKNVAAGQAVIAVLALAVLLPLAAGVFDLSAAQNLGFSAVVCGALMVHEPHASIPVAIVLTLLIGASIGAFNGFLVAIVGLDSFIATLGTSSLLVAGSSIVAGSDYIGPFPSGFSKLTSGQPLGIPVIAIYAVVLAAVVWYVLEHTPLGRRIYATGANRDAARLSGIRTVRFTFWSLVVCGAMASLAGVLLASNLGTVNSTFGPQYLLPAYAAAFLGTTQLKPGRFNAWGTILAILLLGTGVQGLQLVGGHLWVTDLFNGAALIIAISAALIIERLRGRREKRSPDDALALEADPKPSVA